MAPLARLNTHTYATTVEHPTAVAQAAKLHSLSDERAGDMARWPSRQAARTAKHIPDNESTVSPKN